MAMPEGILSIIESGKGVIGELGHLSHLEIIITETRVYTLGNSGGAGEAREL